MPDGFSTPRFSALQSALPRDGLRIYYSRDSRIGARMSAMDSIASDAQLRQSAFDHVNRLAALNSGILDSDDLAAGFKFRGERASRLSIRSAASLSLGKWRRCCPSGRYFLGRAGASGMTISATPTGKY